MNLNSISSAIGRFVKGYESPEGKKLTQSDPRVSRSVEKAKETQALSVAYEQGMASAIAFKHRLLGLLKTANGQRVPQSSEFEGLIQKLFANVKSGTTKEKPANAIFIDLMTKYGRTALLKGATQQEKVALLLFLWLMEN